MNIDQMYWEKNYLRYLENMYRMVINFIETYKDIKYNHIDFQTFCNFVYNNSSKEIISYV